MEGGFPTLNCLLQHTLRSLCSYSDPSCSSKWVYAVFWRILPRNYPPPKWDYGGTLLDRSKGNKRNWILVWEDGFCDFCECEQAGSGYLKGRFGADIFFKMSHEVYNYGEGVVGKAAAENSHKWVFKETPNDTDPTFISPWNMSIEPQPRAWEFQFNSGIQVNMNEKSSTINPQKVIDQSLSWLQTIAVISVREGIIQLGSFDKIVEDLSLVINIQRKFSYLQSIPGMFAMQRPYLPIQYPYVLKPNNQMFGVQDDKSRLQGVNKRMINETAEDSPVKSINLGWNSPQNGDAGSPFWSIPPLLPSMSCSLGALLSKFPSMIPSYNAIEAPDVNKINSRSKRMKADNNGSAPSEVQVAETISDAAQEEKPPNSLEE